jgi:hypothetical protein
VGVAHPSPSDKENGIMRLDLLCLTMLIFSSLSLASPSFPRNEIGGMASYTNNGNARVQRIHSLTLAPVYHYYLSNNLFIGPIASTSWEVDWDILTSNIDLGAEIGYGCPLKNVFPYASIGAMWRNTKTEIGMKYDALGVPFCLGLKILPGGFAGFDIKAGYTYINPHSSPEYSNHDFSLLIGVFGKF